jgi:hypothetical protein
MHKILAICLISLSACNSAPSKPSYATPVAWPVAPTTCTPLPKGLRLYGGTTVADIEQLGKISFQEPERKFLETSSSFWIHFRAGLEPSDTVFEYALDEPWEKGVIHHGGLSAFRKNCTIKQEQAWTT